MMPSPGAEMYMTELYNDLMLEKGMDTFKAFTIPLSCSHSLSCACSHNEATCLTVYHGQTPAVWMNLAACVT